MSSFTGRPRGIAHLQSPAPASPDTPPKPDPTHCAACGAALVSDEIGLTKKLINRGTETFYCKGCLAKRFSMTVADCDELIAHFRAAGCHFFH